MPNETIIPDDVTLYAQKNNISLIFKKAVALANKYFNPISRINVELHTDPETSEKWINIDVILDEDNDVLKQHDDYTGAFIKLAPYEKRKHITLTFSILD